LVIYSKVMGPYAYHTERRKTVSSPSLNDGNNRYSDTDIPLIFRIPVPHGKQSQPGLVIGRTVSSLYPSPDPTDRSRYQNPLRSSPGSQNPGRSQVQTGTDTVWSRKVRYRSGIQIGYPRFSRLLLVKWEIALFKLNLSGYPFPQFISLKRPP